MDNKDVVSPLYKGDELQGYMIFCPACELGHLFDNRWVLSGTLEKPTFKPSMLINKDLKSKHRPLCHSFVTDGNIEYLSDCTHDMAGKTVALKPLT